VTSKSNDDELSNDGDINKKENNKEKNKKESEVNESNGTSTNILTSVSSTSLSTQLPTIEIKDHDKELEEFFATRSNLLQTNSRKVIRMESNRTNTHRVSIAQNNSNFFHRDSNNRNPNNGNGERVNVPLGKHLLSSSL
jgi:hypothetical protein